ncbi:hypothetical protein LF1_05200 [Rubripirellula obstinata]|uniref:Uncharacterized protein n=1 Tax=Rubripirellula obstinata TaxID=406547 RepID=A0A5B1CE34_9BACT|nr:hypothetical protein LF1_05200 [Rubripirellula obstinata]
MLLNIRASAGSLTRSTTENLKRTRRMDGQRSRRLVAKRAGRDLNPLDLSIVCHVLRAGSRVCAGGSDAPDEKKNAIDEVVTRGYYGALPLSYAPASLTSSPRRWDSNPRHPAPEACTPNRQSIVCAFYFVFFLVVFPICFQRERPLSRSSRTSCCCRVSKAIRFPLGRFA